MIDWQAVDLDAPYVSPTARPFKVGDRVRVKLSPECQFGGDFGHRVAGGYEGEVLAVMDTDLIRLIESVGVRLGARSMLDPTHNISVKLESREWFRDGEVYAATFCFAAIELEPLEAAS